MDTKWSQRRDNAFKFTDLIKRKAKELGIEFTKEVQEQPHEPKLEVKPQFESRESSPAAELMMVGRMGRR